MPQLQEQETKRLNDEQRKLIEDNFAEIKQRLAKKINKIHRKYKIVRGYINVDDAISYVPEATLRWIPERGKNIGYINWISNICALRMIDEYRKQYRNEVLIKKRKNIVNKIREELKDDFLTDSEIVEKFASKNKAALTRVNSNILDGFKNVLEAKTFRSDGYLKDLQEEINQYAKEILENDPDQPIYLDIINNFILPKINGSYGSNVKQMSQKHKIPQSSIYNMTRNSKMRRIFQKFI